MNVTQFTPCPRMHSNCCSHWLQLSRQTPEERQALHMLRREFMHHVPGQILPRQFAAETALRQSMLRHLIHPAAAPLVGRPECRRHFWRQTLEPPCPHCKHHWQTAPRYPFRSQIERFVRHRFRIDPQSRIPDNQCRVRFRKHPVETGSLRSRTGLTAISFRKQNTCERNGRT